MKVSENSIRDSQTTNKTGNAMRISSNNYNNPLYGSIS